MGRSRETFNKKEVRKNKEKKRKDKEQKKLARKESETASGDSMIAYVDEFGRILDSPPEHKKQEVKLEDVEIGVPKKSEWEEEDPIRKGTVTFFNDSKGYGFIKDSDSGESIFVHANNLLEEIKEGNLVSFETEKGKKGLAAIQVKVVR